MTRSTWWARTVSVDFGLQVGRFGRARGHEQEHGQWVLLCSVDPLPPRSESPLLCCSCPRGGVSLHRREREPPRAPVIALYGVRH